jgi:hypothetical protein
MNARGMVPQDHQDRHVNATSGKAGSRGSGVVDWALLFATLSSVAIGTQVVIVIIVAMINDPWPGVLALPWLGIAAVVLGLIGMALSPAFKSSSRLRY